LGNNRNKKTAAAKLFSAWFEGKEKPPEQPMGVRTSLSALQGLTLSIVSFNNL
jgi:hypothetical protein